MPKLGDLIKSISKEDIHEDYADSFFSDDEEPQNQLATFNAALERFQELHTTYQIVKESEDITAGVLRQALNIRKFVCLSYDIPMSTTSFSLEAYDENPNSSRQFVQEGLLDSIQKFWKALVDMFKSVWDKITSFFRSSKSNGSNVHNAAKRTSKRAKEVVKNKNTNDRKDISMYIKDAGLLAPISYLNKELDDNEFLNIMKVNVESMRDKLRTVTREISMANGVVLSKFFVDGYFIFAEEPFEAFNQELNNCFIGLNSYINSLDQPEKNILPEQELFQAGYQKHEIVYSELRMISNFIYGAKLFFFKQNRDKTENFYRSLFVRKVEESKDFVRLKYPKIEMLELFAEQVEIMSSGLVTLKHDTENDFTAIDHYQKEILMNCDNFVKDFANNDKPDQLQQGFEQIKVILKLLINMITNLRTSIEYFERTVMYYNTLVGHMTSYYEKGNA